MGRNDGPQDLDLFVSHGIAIEHGRRLHRDDGQQLEQVTLDHVPERPGIVVVAAPPLHTNGLGGGDLDMLDVGPIEDRLEQDIGEPERHHVLHRLLAEVVVDPVDLILGKDGGHFLDERPGGIDVVTKRLLDDDPVPARAVIAVDFPALGDPRIAEIPDDVGERVGRRGEIEEAIALRTTLCVDRIQASAQVSIGLLSREIALNVEEPLAELLPGVISDRCPGSTHHRRPHLFPKAVVRPVTPGHTDDREPLREGMGNGEVVQ